MDTSNFSLGSKKLRLIRDQDDLGGTEVHMGESKEFEISTNKKLVDLAIGDGDSHITKEFEISTNGKLTDLAISDGDLHMTAG